MKLNCSKKLREPFPNTAIILNIKENQLKPSGTIGLATRQICVEMNES